MEKTLWEVARYSSPAVLAKGTFQLATAWLWLELAAVKCHFHCTRCLSKYQVFSHRLRKENLMTVHELRALVKVQMCTHHNHTLYEYYFLDLLSIWFFFLNLARDLLILSLLLDAPRDFKCTFISISLVDVYECRSVPANLFIMLFQ